MTPRKPAVRVPESNVNEARSSSVSMLSTYMRSFGEMACKGAVFDDGRKAR